MQAGCLLFSLTVKPYGVKFSFAIIQAVDMSYSLRYQYFDVQWLTPLVHIFRDSCRPPVGTIRLRKEHV